MAAGIEFKVTQGECATLISQSSGRLSRLQDLTGETRHAVIYP